MRTIRRFVRSRPLGSFLVATFVLAWTLSASLVGISPLAVGLIAFAPGLAAVLVTGLAGREEVLALLRRGTSWRAPRRWYLAVFLAPLLVHAAAAGVAVRLGAQLRIPWPALPALLLVTLVLAAGEELGWQGFLLPRLLPVLPRAAVMALFGGLHAAFHLPMYLLPLPEALRQAASFPLFTLLAVAYAVFRVWFAVPTGCNVGVAVVFHAAINATVLLLAGVERSVLGWLLPIAWAGAAGLLLWLQGSFPAALSGPGGRSIGNGWGPASTERSGVPRVKRAVRPGWSR